MTVGLFDKFLTKKVAVFIIILASAGIYLNTLQNDFVFDDDSEILHNPWIRDIRFIPDIFLSHSWAFKITDSTTSHYHPMKFLAGMIQYSIFGTRPWGYHLTSMIVHIMAAIMIFFIASALLRKKFNDSSAAFPFAAALLFAVHPIHAEAVAWAAAMPELFMTFFYLVSFYLYVNSSGQNRFIVSAVFFFIAALFKEIGITLPLMLLAFDYSFREGIFDVEKSNVRWKALSQRYLPFLSITLFYFLLRTYAIEGFVPKKSYAEFTGYQIIINIAPLFVKYLAMLLLPVKLTALHVFHPVSSLSDKNALAALFIAAIFTAVVFIGRKKDNVVLVGLIWIIIPLLPLFYIPAFIGESAFAERYLYLPSAGAAIAASAFLRRIYLQALFKKMTATALFLGLSLIAVLFSVLTVERNYVWKDNFSLWADTISKSPESYVAHINMGKAYYDKGRADAAVKEYQTALILNPLGDIALFNIGTVYYEQGRVDDAIRIYKAALAIRPDNHVIHNSLGDAYYKKGLLDDAISEYEAALSLKPDFKDAQYNIFVLYTIKRAIDSGKK